MREVCGIASIIKEIFQSHKMKTIQVFCCGNEDSENYGVTTFYDDVCDDFEEKDD